MLSFVLSPLKDILGFVWQGIVKLAAAVFGQGATATVAAGENTALAVSDLRMMSPVDTCPTVGNFAVEVESAV